MGSTAFVVWAQELGSSWCDVDWPLSCVYEHDSITPNPKVAKFRTKDLIKILSDNYTITTLSIQFVYMYNVFLR